MPREDQASVELLRLDLIGLKRLAVFFPVLFLTISGLSIYNLISRMVHAQRSQIGFLRAVGFSRSAVGLHYLEFSLLVGAAGGLLGSLIGYYLGILITRWYTGFIQVPYYDITPKWGVVTAGFVCALAVTTASGLFPALSAARLPPAQAIGMDIPAFGRTPLIERYLPFLRRLSLISRLPLRNFLRNPRRTLATVAGVASATTLILVSSGLLDSTAAAIEFYFRHSIHYDILASYIHPQNQFAMEQVKRWKGVRRVEPVLAVPAKLVKEDVDQTILIYGVEPDSTLLSITTPDGKRIPIEESGLMIAQSTAKKLGLWKGETVHLTLPRRTLPRFRRKTALRDSQLLRLHRPG